MKQKLFVSLMLLSTLASAGAVFDGYEAYYATLPDQLFSSKGVELKPYSMQGDEGVRFGWSGISAGRNHTVNIRDGLLAVDGRTLKPKAVRVFQDEVVSDSDLGNGSVAYFAPGWACVENTPMSASGTAVRHKAVYLVRLANTKPWAWKLPSLFAACAGIRLQMGQIRFDQVEYRYQDGKDDPVGVLFKEYSIQGGKFIPSDRIRSAIFVEPGNVYKFSIDEQ